MESSLPALCQHLCMLQSLLNQEINAFVNYLKALEISNLFLYCSGVIDKNIDIEGSRPTHICVPLPFLDYDPLSVTVRSFICSRPKSNKIW